MKGPFGPDRPRAQTRKSCGYAFSQMCVIRALLPREPKSPFMSAVHFLLGRVSRHVLAVTHGLASHEPHMFPKLISHFSLTPHPAFFFRAAGYDPGRAGTMRGQKEGPVTQTLYLLSFSELPSQIWWQLT